MWLYFGIIGGFNAWFDGIVNNLYWFDRMNTGFLMKCEYLDHENKRIRCTVPCTGRFLFIEFKNVSYTFRYDEIISDLNLKIRKEKRKAVVGLNGAGKQRLQS